MVDGFVSECRNTFTYCWRYAYWKSEVLVTDINLVSREILIVDGKGDKSRTVFMGDKVKIVLQYWLRERKEKEINCAFLFSSNRNSRLDRTVVNRLVNTYPAKIGKDITLHDLRHFNC